MSWIQEYRESIGLTRGQFARAITRQLGGSGDNRIVVPEKLIFMLEEWPKCYTHPRLADMIAAACGATPEQRDMIVARVHRGKWRGVDGPRVVYELPPTRLPIRAKAQPMPGDRYAHNNRPVVVIDRAGNEVKRCASGKEAAEFMGLSTTTVYSRCAHATPLEFTVGIPYTCRYAQEWDALTPSAKAASIRMALKNAGDSRTRPKGCNIRRAVVAIDRDGRELARYASIGEAERGEAFNEDCIRNRCNRQVKNEFTGINDSTYRFANEWDAMTPEERLRDVRSRV